jgi:hypothetical protein
MTFDYNSNAQGSKPGGSPSCFDFSMSYPTVVERLVHGTSFIRHHPGNFIESLPRSPRSESRVKHFHIDASKV